MAIEKHFGQLCWTLENGGKKVYVTIQGGNLTCDFPVGDRRINPFYVFPWWNEPQSLTLDPLSQVMRGDFFCFPFGLDDSTDPPTYHGPTASGCWAPSRTGFDSPDAMELVMNLAQGTVTKRIEIRAGDPLIYQRHTISGFEGDMPFGYHPILRFPEGLETGLIAISDPVSGHTTPQPLESSGGGGYSKVAPGNEITSMRSIPCVDGSVLDASVYPHTPGHEDLMMFVTDQTRAFAYSAVSFPGEGYLYFQLKNPRTLGQTIFWLSNGGRWYPPWSGRVRGVMGIEEVTAFFHYGKTASTEPNFLSRKGVPTCRTFTREEEFAVPLIMGVIGISPSFGRVKSIEQAVRGGIVIRGERNEEIPVQCDLEFLS